MQGLKVELEHLSGRKVGYRTKLAEYFPRHPGHVKESDAGPIRAHDILGRPCPEGGGAGYAPYSTKCPVPVAAAPRG